MIAELTQFMALLLALVYLNQIRLNTPKIFMVFLIVFVPTMLALTYLSQIPGIIWLLLSMTTLFYIFTKTKWILVDMCAITIIGIFADNLTQLLQSALNIRARLFPDPYLLLFICLFAVFVVSYNYLFKRKMKNVSFSLTNQIIAIVLAIITVVVFYLNVFVLHGEKLLFLNFIVQIVYIVMICLLFFLFITTTKKELAVQQKEVAQQQFLDYMQALARVNEDMQKFRHDYLNILVSMRGYIDAENMEGLSNYFYTAILPAEQQTFIRNQMLGKLERIGMLEVKSVIASKMIQADNVHIPVNLEIPQPIPTLSIAPIDITRVLGIYLDNAIEASEDVKHPQINIAFFIEEQRVILIIENKYNGADVHIDALYTTDFSTKNQHRGRGLMNARAILTTYENVTMNTRTEKDWFIQEIQIELGG